MSTKILMITMLRSQWIEPEPGGVLDNTSVAYGGGVSMFLIEQPRQIRMEVVEQESSRDST